MPLVQIEYDKENTTGRLNVICVQWKHVSTQSANLQHLLENIFQALLSFCRLIVTV